jgi:hypothetical protein
MAADAVQLAVGLVDGIRIEAVAGGWHATRDHPVGKRPQVDAKEFRSTPDLCFVTISRPRFGRVG